MRNILDPMSASALSIQPIFITALRRVRLEGQRASRQRSTDLSKSLGDWDDLNRSIFDFGNSTFDFTSPSLLNLSVFVETSQQ